MLKYEFKHSNVYAIHVGMFKFIFKHETRETLSNFWLF